MNSFNDPLLYIKGPPVFHLPPSMKNLAQTDIGSIEEESTSIYEIKSTVQEKSSPIMEQLRFLSKPFQRQVYRPLTFHIEGGLIIQGEVEQLDQSQKQVTIKTRAGETMVYPVEEVKRVTWRGSILK